MATMVKEKQAAGRRLGSDRATQFQLHSLMLPGTILRNTLGINLIGNIIQIPACLIFALLINEIGGKRLKGIVQTVTYMPHFIAWTVFGGIIITMLSSDGMLNQFLLALHVVEEPVMFMAEPKYFWIIAILSNLIKEVGWGTILYTAAIAGIDPTLYEAAELDGAGRVRKMVSVTIPCIRQTLVIMIIFAVAGIMNNSFDQLYVLQNSFNLETSEVIDTYIYKVGLQQLQFGMAAAINIFKSVIAIALLFVANKVSTRITDESLF